MYSSLPVININESNTTESNSINFNITSPTSTPDECNLLTIEYGNYINIEENNICGNPHSSLNRSVVPPSRVSISNGKSSRNTYDIPPCKVKEIDISCLGIEELLMLQIKALCGSLSISFDCSTWISGKTFFMDLIPPLIINGCEGDTSSQVESRPKKVYMRNNSVDCIKGKPVKVEFIAVGQ
jgi:hypothetical protein